MAPPARPAAVPSTRILPLAVLLAVVAVTAVAELVGDDGGRTGPAPDAVAFHAAWLHYRQQLLARGYSADTVRTYRQPLRAFIRFLAPRHWTQMRPDDLDAFLTSRPLAPKSRETYTTAVTRFTRFAHRAGLLPVDPMADFVTPRRPRRALPRAIPWDDPPRDPAEPDAPPKTGMATLLAHAATDQRLELAILFGYRAGLRVSEIAGLRIENLWLGPDPRMRVVGKGGVEDVLEVHPWLADALRAYLRGRTRGPVVRHATRPGVGVSGKYIGNLIAVAMRTVGTVTEWGTPATPHSLRHTFGTELRRSGADIDDIRRAMRHRSFDTTMLYIVAADERHPIRRLPDRRGHRP